MCWTAAKRWTAWCSKRSILARSSGLTRSLLALRRTAPLWSTRRKLWCVLPATCNVTVVGVGVVELDLRFLMLSLDGSVGLLGLFC